MPSKRPRRVQSWWNLLPLARVRRRSRGRGIDRLRAPTIPDVCLFAQHPAGRRDGNAGPQGTQVYYPGGYILLGTPKVATPSYQKVLFYVDKATSQVRRVLIVDGQGNLNKFTFESPHVNDAIEPGTFTFTPPPGTNIVRP